MPWTDDVETVLLDYLDMTSTIVAIDNEGAGDAVQVTTEDDHGLTADDVVAVTGTGVPELDGEAYTVASAPTSTTLVMAETVEGGPYAAATGSVEPYSAPNHSAGRNLFTGPATQAADEQVFVQTGGPPASSSYITVSGGPPPELSFGSVDGEPRGWRYSGFEIVTKSPPRNYEAGRKSARRLHRLLVAARPNGSGIKRTSLLTSEPELLAPNRNGQHIFSTRGDAWFRI